MKSTEINPAVTATSALHPIAVALTGAAVVWTVIVFAVPFAAPSLDPTPRLTAIVYGTGALLCHQQSARSFHLRGAQMPVCARCTALYLSGAIGALAAWLGRPRSPRRARAVLMLSALPMALSVALEWTGLVPGSNLLRAATALPAGGMAGWVIVRLLRSERMRYDLVV